MAATGVQSQNPDGAWKPTCKKSTDKHAHANFFSVFCIGHIGRATA